LRLPTIEATEERDDAQRVEEISVALIDDELKEGVLQWIAQMVLRAVRDGAEEGDERQ
jgi:hypothetical protein